MDALTVIILFVFGIAIGSFLNVVALRYDGDHFVFSDRLIGGRSHCPRCGHTLKWFELIPLVSFAVQGAMCRSCKARIGWQYPLVELLSGLIFVFVPAQPIGAHSLFLSVLWTVVFEIVLLVAYIDIRLQIVPDELTIILAAAAIFADIFAAGTFGPANYSFLAPYAAPFGLQGNLWLSRIAGAAFGAGFFALLIAVTKGKGMGWGDVKLAAPLGLLFGWPDILFVLALAFVVGAIVGVALIARRSAGMKSPVPFVPFLAAASAFVFFFGGQTLAAYFHIIGV